MGLRLFPTIKCKWRKDQNTDLCVSLIDFFYWEPFYCVFYGFFSTNFLFLLERKMFFSAQEQKPPLKIFVKTKILYSENLNSSFMFRRRRTTIYKTEK